MSHIVANLIGSNGGVAACRRSNEHMGMIVFVLAIEVLMNVGQMILPSLSGVTSLTSPIFNPISVKKFSNEYKLELISDSLCCVSVLS
jgi:uncharacterized ion transporter superfamily protein YfcC